MISFTYVYVYNVSLGNRAITIFSKSLGSSVWVGIGLKRSYNFLGHFYLVKKVVQLIQSLGRLVLAVIGQANWLNFLEITWSFSVGRDRSQEVIKFFFSQFA